MHPFLDTSKLTDEEIIERLGRAYNFLNYQKSLGHVHTVESIKEVIESLELEKSKRYNDQVMSEMKKKNPKLNDPIELGKLEE